MAFLDEEQTTTGGDVTTETPVTEPTAAPTVEPTAEPAAPVAEPTEGGADTDTGSTPETPVTPA